jgi:hypothetical protein
MAAPGSLPGRIFGTLKGHRRFFSTDDDQVLRQLKANLPNLSWPQISERMPGFTPRQLRERWCNYLSPNLRTVSWTPDEDRELVRLHDELGPRWGLIGSCMGNRSAPDIKNRYQCVQHRSERTEAAAAAAGQRQVHPKDPYIPHRPSPPPLQSLPPPPPLQERRMPQKQNTQTHSKTEAPQSAGTEFSIKNLLAS